jgi:hypothetical protein
MVQVLKPLHSKQEPLNSIPSTNTKKKSLVNCCLDYLTTLVLGNLSQKENIVVVLEISSGLESEYIIQLCLYFFYSISIYVLRSFVGFLS